MSTETENPQKTRNVKSVNEIVRRSRTVDNFTNFAYIAFEYLTLAAFLGGAIGFFEFREGWGLAWAWNVPIAFLAIVGIGVVQHRLAGLVHEASHYMLFKNRLLNEWASDLLCMFPLFSTTAQYRVMHLGHHDYVNDWQRDPELLNMGRTRMMDRFPMPIREFVSRFYIRTLWPPTLFRYVWDNLYCITLGNAKHPYRADESQPQPPSIGPFRLTSVLGLAYFGVAIGVIAPLAFRVDGPTLVAASVGLWSAASAVALALPDAWYFQQCFKPVVSSKATSVVRLGYLTCVELILSLSRAHLGPQWGAYFYLLWVVPLFSTWPYFMLLRDLYQHANTDDGKLTNSRVIVVHPLVRWAMFIYGQDIHLTHHLYPTVPHYRLPQLHRQLVEHDAEYAANVVECHGIFRNDTGKPTAIACIAPSAGKSERGRTSIDSAA